jgi:predicted nuclease of restriction endonuclease-like (RecB) superfamily
MNALSPALQTIQNLKQLVKNTRIKAMLKVNSEAIAMYFEMGKELAHNIDSNDGSKNIVREASLALIEEFGKGEGYSERNLFNMIKFYREAELDSQLHQLGALLPWKHTCTILDRVKNGQERLWYMKTALEIQWGRETLEYHIKQDRYNKELAKGEPTTNFELKLTENSELANEIVKDEYIIEVFGAKKQTLERDIENQIIRNIKTFLTELGEGFCYIGNQNTFETDGEEYRTDLLFFNRKLKCLFAIEIKAGKFKPEYISKMEWYLHLLDTQMKLPEENQSIGIILCGSKDNYQVKTLLKDSTRPIAVATHEIVEKLQAKVEALMGDGEK